MIYRRKWTNTWIQEKETNLKKEQTSKLSLTRMVIKDRQQKCVITKRNPKNEYHVYWSNFSSYAPLPS